VNIAMVLRLPNALFQILTNIKDHRSWCPAWLSSDSYQSSFLQGVQSPIPCLSADRADHLDQCIGNCDAVGLTEKPMFVPKRKTDLQRPAGQARGGLEPPRRYGALQKTAVLSSCSLFSPLPGGIRKVLRYPFVVLV
jgi:hypothetical protein